MQKLTTHERNLHNQFRECGYNVKEWMRKCAFLLPKIAEMRIWQKKGFSSIYEYAAKLAGMSKWQVDDALRIIRKIKDKPKLKEVAEEKGLGAVRPVVTIATEETEEFWAEKAREMSKNTLETYVREFKKENGPRTKSREVIRMELDEEIAEELEKLKGEGDWNALMKELLTLRKAKLKEKKPAPKEKAKRYIPAKIKQYVVEQTNGNCAFPNCQKPYQILHHTERFALNKRHDPDTLVPLCKGHERLAHLGLIENEEMPAQFWSIRKTADQWHPKYFIDRKVQKYRKPG